MITRNSICLLYRIKMCTDITHKDFITVHHELAHIQYFLNYRNNPKIFRDGSNPGNWESEIGCGRVSEIADRLMCCCWCYSNEYQILQMIYSHGNYRLPSFDIVQMEKCCNFFMHANDSALLNELRIATCFQSISRCCSTIIIDISSLTIDQFAL